MQVTLINDIFDGIIYTLQQHVLVVCSYQPDILCILTLMKEQYVGAAKSQKITVMSSERPRIASHK